MIENVVKKLVCKMKEENMIRNFEDEFYIYALVSLIERGITFGTIMLIGFLCNEIISTLCFMDIFFSLRKRTGGYHADKFMHCYLATVITYVLVMYISKIFCERLSVMYITLFLSAFMIYAIGTVNHPNMNMDSCELKEAKKASRRLVAIQVTFIVVLNILGVNELYLCNMSIAIILCAILMCLAKIKKQEVKYDEKR